MLLKRYKAMVDFLEPVPGYFEALENICRENGILIAVDDIQQGFGRTATWVQSRILILRLI